MNRPKLNITSGVLDRLGFSPYEDETGEWGFRELGFENGIRFRIVNYDEMDVFSQQGGDVYVAEHFVFLTDFAIPKIEKRENLELYFLHEMYFCINKYYADCLNEFREKCFNANMMYYLDQIE